MKLTPFEIQQQQFKTRFRGFDVREVETFLEQMADAFESLQSKNESLREEINKLEHESQGYKQREETFKRAMLNSQKVLEQMKQNAQKSAELVIADSEVQAEKILSRANNRMVHIQGDIAELKRQRMQIEVQIRSIIESHTKLLEISEDEAKTMDVEDAKLELFKKAK